MTRRLASVAVALVLSGCALPLIGSTAPQYGFITVTDAGRELVAGANDVPPTLDLRMHAAAALRVQDVTATLDGRTLPLLPAGDDLTASVKPMPLGSSHHLSVSIADRAQGISVDFSVIAPTEAMLAAHIDPSQGLVVDGVFADGPDQAAVGAAFPEATVTWRDALHVRAVWSGSHPGSVTIPGTVATARGSHLAGSITLGLAGIARGTVRIVNEPPGPSVTGTPVIGFVVDTGASNTSFARHEHALTTMVATGWQAQADGSILGTPDPTAVPRAAAAGLTVWPSLANDTTNPAATTALLADQGAVSRLVGTVVRSAAFGGFPGVNLDFEGMAAGDRDPFTAFVKTLASALHAKGIRLMVDVVPHDTSGTNGFSVAYDVPALGQTADYIDLMAYDEHGNGGSPGPVAGLDWDTSVLAATLPGLNASHVFLGVPLYARRWGSAGSGAASYAEAVAGAISVPGARVGYDFSAETPAIFSPDGSLVTYFDDADSLAHKIALVRSNGLAGIAAWRLGYEDPAFWSLFG